MTGPVGPSTPSPVEPPAGLTRLASLRPLRHRNYAVVWWAGLVSTVGTWMETVAVGALITELTGQARWPGLVAAAAFLPLGVLGPVGGAIADRVDRRRFLVVTTLAQTAVAAVLALVAATGSATPVTILAVVLAGGCVAAVTFPAYSAMLPDLVPREDLLAAASLFTAEYNLGRVVGPALAGVVIATGGYSLAFALNAVSFLAVLAAVAVLRLPPRPPGGEEEGLWRRIRDGARATRAEPGCRAAIGLVSLLALTCSPFIALIPAVAKLLFDSGDGGVSLLVTAQGVGAVAGALVLPSLAAHGRRRRVLLASFAAVPVTLLAYAAAPTLALAAVALAAVGAAYIGALSGLSTVVQLRAPAALRGRILSLYFVALGAVYPLGAVVQGRLADELGLRTVTAGGAVAFAAVVTLIGLTRPRLLAALDDPEVAVEGTSRHTLPSNR